MQTGKSPKHIYKTKQNIGHAEAMTTGNCRVTVAKTAAKLENKVARP
jgi:hypothetical protein